MTPPLLQARQARRLRLDDVAGGLVRLLGLPAEARGRVRSHYQDLELGRLDPAGVAASVWVALARLFERDAGALAAAPAPAPAPGAAMYRATSRLEPAITDYATVHRREPVEVDEADRLFGVSPPR